MQAVPDRARTAATAVLTGLLLAAGVVEVVGAGIGLADGPDAAVALGHPAALLPFTLASLVATFSGRRHRIAAFFGATGALATRVVASLLVVLGSGPDLVGLLEVVAGLLTGVGVFFWTLFLVLHNRDLSELAPPSGPPQPPSVSPCGDPATGVAPGNWATAGTPWPRADEDDPDGTLIRPPRR